MQGQEQAEQTQKHKQQRSSPDPQQLQALWRHFVEGACLSSSHERKALALQLLQLLLPVMGPDMVPVVLCKPLLGCVATALKDKDSYLHACAKRCLVSHRRSCSYNFVLALGSHNTAAEARGSSNSTAEHHVVI